LVENLNFCFSYYNSIGRTYLFDIDFWFLKSDSGEDDWHNTYTIDAYHAGNVRLELSLRERMAKY
jgi:hypothetical protein